MTKQIKSSGPKIILTVLIFCVFSSCKRDKFDCYYYSGCQTMTVKYYLKDSFITEKTYCTDKNMMTDKAFIDSINSFKAKFSSTYIISDTYNYSSTDKKMNLTTKKTKKYPDYYCEPTI